MIVHPNLSNMRLRLCNKCGRGHRKIERHHKGYESLFCSFLPNRYQADYEKFRKEDIVELCGGRSGCHNKIHRIYARRLGRWGFWALVAKQDGKLTFKQCEHYRRLLIQECHEWLARKNGLLRRNALERTFSNSLDSSRKQLKKELGKVRST